MKCNASRKQQSSSLEGRAQCVGVTGRACARGAARCWACRSAPPLPPARSPALAMLPPLSWGPHPARCRRWRLRSEQRRGAVATRGRPSRLSMPTHAAQRQRLPPAQPRSPAGGRWVAYADCRSAPTLLLWAPPEEAVGAASRLCRRRTTKAASARAASAISAPPMAPARIAAVLLLLPVRAPDCSTAAASGVTATVTAAGCSAGRSPLRSASCAALPAAAGCCAKLRGSVDAAGALPAPLLAAAAPAATATTGAGPAPPTLPHPSRAAVSCSAGTGSCSQASSCRTVTK